MGTTYVNRTYERAFDMEQRLAGEWRQLARKAHFVLAMATGLVAVGLAAADDRPGPMEPEFVKLLKPAYFAAKHNLRSGIGEGWLEHYRDEPGKTELSLVQKARAKVFFDGDKYHVRLDYEKDALYRMRKRILIYDGTAFLSTVFFDNPKIKNSQGEVYDAGKGGAPPDPTVFPFNPARMPDMVFNLEQLLGNHEASSTLSIRKDATGTLIGSFKVEGLPFQFSASPRSGYHVTTFIFGEPEVPRQQEKASWDHKDNVWFVRTIEIQSKSLEAGFRQILRYDRFEPNAHVPEELFTFKAAEISPNGRILDRRRNAPAPVLHNATPNQADTKDIDNLVEQLKNLPPQIADVRGGASRQAVWSWLVIASGAIATVVGAVIFCVRDRGRRST